MAHIEFLGDPTRPGESATEALDVEPRDGRTGWRKRLPALRRRLVALRTVVPAVLAVAATVLVLVAPWQRLYELSELFDANERRAVGTDGWGRYFSGFGPTDQHSTRFGIVLCVAAGLVLTGAALRILSVLRERLGWERVGSWTLGAAIGILGGTLASAALQADSVFDAIDAQRAAEEGGGAQLDGFDNGIHLGPMLYLGFGGMALALLALVTPVVLDRLLAVPAYTDPIGEGPQVIAAPPSIIVPSADDPGGPVPTGRTYDARLAGPWGEDERLD